MKTSARLLVPILSDTGHLNTRVGHFTMCGASAAEIGTIGLLGLFFAGKGTSATVSALLLGVVAVLAVLLLAALRYTLLWAPGRRIFEKLDDSSAQVRVRFSVMILLAAATLTMQFGFEGILGTFVAGIVVGVVLRGDRFEHALRSKLKVVGFGLFVPAFFVTSGVRFELDSITGMREIGRAGLFLVMLVAIHTIPTVLYRPLLTWRECLASGLLQATNLLHRRGGHGRNRTRQIARDQWCGLDPRRPRVSPHFPRGCLRAARRSKTPPTEVAVKGAPL